MNLAEPNYLFVHHSGTPNARAHIENPATQKPLCGAKLRADATEWSDWDNGYDPCKRCQAKLEKLRGKEEQEQ